MTRLKLLMVAMLGTAALAGCGGVPEGQFPTAPVEVTVMYKGKPVEEAVITFIPKDSANVTPGKVAPAPAFGKTDANGKAKMQTYAPNDGAVIGEHFVGIVKQEFLGPKVEEAKSAEDYAPPLAGASPLPKVKDLLPKKYNMPTTSTLTAKVEKVKQNEVTFELKD